jgi:predicted dehydrogenase
MAKKKLNIGLVGYGFMGRTHSNAFLQAPRYFDLPFEPVLKAVAPRTGVMNQQRPTGARSWIEKTSI